MNKDEVADYLLSIIRPLAPEVSCDISSDDMGVLYTLAINDEHKGKVLGRGGETIKAVRHMVSLVGYANGIRASVKVT